MSKPELSVQVLAMAGQVDRLTHRVEGQIKRVDELGVRQSERMDRLEQLVRELASQIESVTEALADEDDERPAGTTSWLLIDDPIKAQEVLEDLEQWLAAVYLRYEGASLPTCWRWHPAVVEELWALRQAHREAYQSRNSSPAKLMDWHDRQRPGVAKRLGNRAIANCDLMRHPLPGPVVPLPCGSARVASAWATTHSEPEPTQEQRDQAETYDQNQITRSSTR